MNHMSFSCTTLKTFRAAAARSSHLRRRTHVRSTLNCAESSRNLSDQRIYVPRKSTKRNFQTVYFCGRLRKSSITQSKSRSFTLPTRLSSS